MTQQEILDYIAVNEYTQVVITPVIGNPNISQLYNSFIWKLDNGYIVCKRVYSPTYEILNETYTFKAELELSDFMLSIGEEVQQ